ncbi:MAG: hypothetical protein ACRERD_02975, partial [Candidatus Binatia bacterium]
MKLAHQRRLWSIIAVLLILGATLVACGGGAADDEPGDAPQVGDAPAEDIGEETPAGEAPAEEATEAPAEGEETEGAAEGGGAMGGLLNPEVSGEVEFWHFWGSPVRRTAIRRVVALCQSQLPNTTITEVFKPFGDIWTANIAAVAAGSGMPDV